MRRILTAIAVVFGLIGAALGQGVPNFPQTLPTNTVVGRLGIGPGPSQAIPFANLASRLTPYLPPGPGRVSATAYGALCNGSFDDTTAIQSAVNALPLGGIVLLPAGTCMIPTGTITIAVDAVTIEGAGLGGNNSSGTTIVCGSSSSDCFKWSTVPTAITGGGMSGVRIDASARTGTAAAISTYGSSLTFHDIFMYARNGWNIYASTAVTIENITGYGLASGASGTYGIKWWGDTTHAANVLQLKNIQYNMQSGGGDCYNADGGANTLVGVAVGCVNARYGFWASNVNGDATHYPAFIGLFRFENDVGTGASIQLDAGRQFTFVDTYSYLSNADYAVNIASGVIGAKFVGGQIGNSAKSCAYIAGTEVEFHGVKADLCNSWGTASATYPVYDIQATASKVRIFGGLAGAGSGLTATTSYGVKTTGAASDIVVVGTDLSGNVTGALSLSGTTTTYNIDTAQVSSRSIDFNASKLTGGADFYLTGAITPSQITSDQSNYTPANLSTASVLRLSTDATRNITGLAGGAAGRFIYIDNVGSFSIVLKDASGLSSSANQFAFGVDITIGAGGGVSLRYDTTTSHWRAVGLFAASGAGSGGTVTSIATTSPITGGTITTTGTIACATCVTSAAALTSGQLVAGAGLQATAVTNLTGDVTTSGGVATTIAANAVTLAKLATQATNTVLGNATSGTAVPTALAVGTCSTASSALIWTTNTGFGCNTSITAAAVPASGLTGSTLASGVTASSLTSLGTITSLTATTINAFTLGGTISGGGNQINNVVIGTSSALAGTFTAITGTSSTINGTETITSSSATAFTVGRLGSTTPALQVDASTATSITGIKIKSAASTGGVAISAIGEAANGNLTIDAQGTGTITLGGTSTGAITLTRATTMSAALTYGGVALSNAVTGTGNMVLSASPTLTGTLTAATTSFSGHMTIEGVTSTGATGTGKFVFDTTPTFTTNATVPLIIGGSGTTGTQLTLQTTSGNGTTDAFAIKGGNNGGTTFETLSATGVVYYNFGGTTNVKIGAVSNYSIISLNNDITLSGGVGLIGGATGDATTLYMITPGTVTFRTGNTDRFQFSSSGIIPVADNTYPLGSSAHTYSGVWATLASDAAATDNTVCVLSTGEFRKGSGTLGICLGTSSERYKRDIVPMAGGLADVLRLQPKSFFYRPGYGDDGARAQVGFIAEDVVHVVPQLVGLGADGRPNSVDMLGMVPLTVLAIQQLNDRLERLERIWQTDRNQIERWRELTPEEAARSHVPLMRHTDR